MAAIQQALTNMAQVPASVDLWLGALLSFLFHPLIVVHVGSWLITKFLKHFIAQWIPLWFYNCIWKRIFNGAPPRSHCPRALRYTLSIILASATTYVLTMVFWPDGMSLNGYSKDKIAFINAMFNPFIFFITMKYFKRSKIHALNSIAEWFSARDLNWSTIEQYKTKANEKEVEEKIIMLKQALGIEDNEDLTMRFQKKNQDNETE